MIKNKVILANKNHCRLNACWFRYMLEEYLEFFYFVLLVFSASSYEKSSGAEPSIAINNKLSRASWFNLYCKSVFINFNWLKYVVVFTGSIIQIVAKLPNIRYNSLLKIRSISDWQEIPLPSLWLAINSFANNNHCFQLECCPKKLLHRFQWKKIVSVISASLFCKGHMVTSCSMLLVEYTKNIYNFHWWKSLFQINFSKPSSLCQIFSPNDSPSKTMTNIFDFILKALFVLKIFKFL